MLRLVGRVVVCFLRAEQPPFNYLYSIMTIVNTGDCNDKCYDEINMDTCKIMGKRKLDRKREFIQVPINPEDKAAFDAWCAANQTTMSEVVRRSIAPYVLKGQELRQEVEQQMSA